MIYRIEYRHERSPLWHLGDTVEGADEARLSRKEIGRYPGVAETRVLKQTWVPVNLEDER